MTASIITPAEAKAERSPATYNGPPCSSTVPIWPSGLGSTGSRSCGYWPAPSTAMMRSGPGSVASSSPPYESAAEPNGPLVPARRPSGPSAGSWPPGRARPRPRSPGEQARIEGVAAFADRVARVAPVVERDGPRVAELLEQAWQDRRRVLTWAQLGHLLGWRASDVKAIAFGMVEAGWVTRSRRPPFHRRPTSAG